MSELRSLTAIVDTFLPALNDKQLAQLATNLGELHGDAKKFAASSGSQLIGNVADEIWATINKDLADKVRLLHLRC